MMFPGLACLPNTKCPPKPTKSLGQTRKAHQYLRNARSNTKSPPIPTKSLSKTRKAHQYPRNASAKREMLSNTHEMPTNTHEMLGQTRNAHQYPRKASAKREMPNNTHEMPRPNTKCLTKPRPHPRPLSHRERGACFIKNKKPSPKTTKRLHLHNAPSLITS